MLKRAVALLLSAPVLPLLAVAPPAAAQPSCVAQSIMIEHQAFGTSWGRELVAFLATHPEVLQEFGFANIGDLTRFAAAQDRTNCPPDL